MAPSPTQMSLLKQKRGGYSGDGDSISSYATLPPSSAYHHGRPTIDGSTGAFAAVVTICGLVFLAALAGLYVFYRRRKSRRSTHSATYLGSTAPSIRSVEDDAFELPSRFNASQTHLGLIAHENPSTLSLSQDVSAEKFYTPVVDGSENPFSDEQRPTGLYDVASGEAHHGAYDSPDVNPFDDHSRPKEKTENPFADA